MRRRSGQFVDLLESVCLKPSTSQRPVSLSLRDRDSIEVEKVILGGEKTM